MGRVKLARAQSVARRGRVSHQTCSLPDHGFLIAQGARCGVIGGEPGPDGSSETCGSPTLTSLRREKRLYREDGASRQHVIDGASNLVREDRQRLPLAVCLLQARQ